MTRVILGVKTLVIITINSDIRKHLKQLILELITNSFLHALSYTIQLLSKQLVPIIHYYKLILQVL